MLKYILFDLDETLYPRGNGLMQAVGNRMREWIMARFSLSLEQAEELQKRYWHEYGTTLRGLYLERQIDPKDYLEYVHNLHLPDYLLPDPRLREVLERIPQDKFILTNADAAHARRTLALLGVSHLFVRIFDIVCFEYDCKPAPAVYRRVLQEIDARPEECVLVEDMARNLIPARDLGIHSILVGTPADGCHVADVCIETIYDVADAVALLSAQASSSELTREAARD